MRRVCRVSSLFVLLAASTSLMWADQVVLTNGDRITGKVVKLEDGKLTIDAVSIGKVEVPWTDVASVTTDEPIYVVLPGDRTVQSAISTQDGQVQVSGEGATPLTDIQALRNDSEEAAYERFLNPGLFQLWTVSGSINFAGTKGNANTSTFTTPINFARKTRTSTTTAYFTSIKASATVNGVSNNTAKAIRGGWAYSRNFDGRFFTNAFNDWEYDKFQSLDLRVVLGGGIGYHAWQREQDFLDVVAGGNWNREAFSPATAPSFARNSGEIYWGDNAHYQLIGQTTLTQSFRLFNNITRRGQFRMNFDLTATTKLTSWLTWNVSGSDRFLSNPVQGRKTNDFLYSTGFGFTFGQ